MASITLTYPVGELPIALAVALQYVGSQNVKAVPQSGLTTVQVSVDNHTLSGTSTVLRYLARVFPEAGLYGKPVTDHFVTTKVDEWFDYASTIVQLDPQLVAAHLNQELTLRTLLADYRITIADIAVWAGLKKTTGWEAFYAANHKKFPHLARWINYLEYQPNFQAVIAKSTASTAAAKSRTGAQGSFQNIELPGASMGNVCTRFPPEPSGYLHIGHVKAALLNDHYARYYKGKLVVRFDDTNPSKEKVEYVDAILEDLKTLGVVPDHISYTSDFFDVILQKAEQMIKDGIAYVDDTPAEQMKQERGQGIESKYRNASVEDNLARWKEMLDFTQNGRKMCLRAKIDMQSKNKCLRDPAIARCNETPHHRTGTKFKVYPLYDLACPIVDSLEGVTHALRSSEYVDRNALYNWILEATKVRKVHITGFSRLNFAYTLMSKRKLQWFVDSKKVPGWDDARFPTIRGMLRRGLTVSALREFILSQGASKSLTLMEPEKLWAINKKVIDPVVPRYTAIVKSTAVVLTLTNVDPTPVHKSVPRHKKNPDLGEKVIQHTNKVYLEGLDANQIENGEEVTLMDWGNAIVEKVDKAADGKTVSLTGRLHLEGSVKTTKKKLTWLPVVDDLTSVTLINFGYLITKKKLEEDDDFIQFVNEDSKHEVEAYGDLNLRLVARGDKIQLERRGYFICDEAYLKADKPIVFFEIPDGHSTHAISVLTTKPDQPQAQAPAPAKTQTKSG